MNDCALSAHSLEDIQTLVGRFAAAAKRLELTISLKNQQTDVLAVSFWQSPWSRSPN